jgi:probable O-glycosylation ligase (exosortase A-associated)
MHLEDTDRGPESTGGRSHWQRATEWWRPETSIVYERHLATPTDAAATGTDSSGPFVALLAFTFVMLISPQSFFPALTNLRPAWIAAVAAVSLQLLDRVPKGKPLLWPGREPLIVVALIGWAIVTLPFSYWPGGSFSTIADLYSKTLVIFWLLGLTINSVQRLSKVVWALSLIAIPLAYVGVANYLSGNIMSGAGNRIVGYEGALTQNPNDLALTLNLIIPLTIGLLSIRQPLRARLFLLLSLLISLMAVVCTRSRGGFLTLLAIWLFYGWKLSRRGKFGWPVAVLIAVLLCVPLLPSDYLSRMNTITRIEEDETGSAQDRWEGMIAGVGFVLEHPVTGAGIGMNLLALNDLLGPTWRSVHNVYLEYAMDLGFPGLVLYLMLTVSAFRSTILVCRRTADVPGLRPLFHLSEALQGSLCAFVVGGFFAPVAYNFYFYYIAGLAVGARQALQRLGDQRGSGAS